MVILLHICLNDLNICGLHWWTLHVRERTLPNWNSWEHCAGQLAQIKKMAAQNQIPCFGKTQFTLMYDINSGYDGPWLR